MSASGQSVYKNPRFLRLRRGILSAAGHVCEICGEAKATVVDHVVPLAHGGAAFDPDNLRAACRSCNARGGAAITNYQRRQRSREPEPGTWNLEPGWDAGAVAGAGGAGGEWAAPTLVAGHGGEWGQVFDCGQLASAGVDLGCPSSDVFRRPLYATAANPAARHRLVELDGLARALGIDLLPWQRYVLRVASELTADGLPAYRQVVLSVARQCGKSIVGALLAADQLIGTGRPRIVVWVAGTLTAGLALWRDDIAPAWEAAGVGCRSSWGATSPRLVTAGGTLPAVRGQQACGRWQHGRPTHSR